MLQFDYYKGLYRRNNFGQPCVWYARPLDYNSIEVFHGILGKTITRDIIYINREPREEITSRINAKLKVGYKNLWDIKDNVQLPVEGELLAYLDKYLPVHRTTADGTLLPMLAKVYNNTNNKLFKKVSRYIGQYKINGLRCLISAYHNNNDLFGTIRLKFQSREGTYWNSLHVLESYLLDVFPKKLIDAMIEEHYILDGELYLPGHSVNEINHFVKDPICKENKLIQFWCYDIAIDDVAQYSRLDYLYTTVGGYYNIFTSKEDHLNNKDKFILLPQYNICNEDVAYERRNKFIDLGFEGLIMRNPEAEYQYGKRNLSMIKYKKSTDGKFTIVDIYPEGVKRKDIPLFLLRNDINDETFEVHLGGSFSYQKYVLDNKEDFIGKEMFVEYGERSGVAQVPFHVKQTYIIDK